MSLIERYGRDLETQLQFGIWEYDYVDKVMQWSEGVYTIFECSPSNFSPIIEAHNPFFDVDASERIRKAVRTIEILKQPTSTRVDITLASQRLKTIEITFECELINGEIRKRYGLIKDVTETEKERIDNSFFRERVELALTASNTGTWDYHVADDNLFWDASMLEIFDILSPDKIQGFSSWIDMIHPEDRAQFIDQFNLGSKGFAENNTVLITTRILTSMGRIAFIKINARFYIDSAGQIFRILGTCVDTTDSELIQREIVNQATLAQENLIKAQDATAARSRFLANMSHEIRTPMNTIMGAIQILESIHTDDDSTELVEMAMSSCRDLLSLINDILDLSKIDAHEMSVESIDLNIIELINSARGKFELLLDPERVKINVKVQTDINPKRVGDPVKFNQILNNLLSNAVKFTNDGDITIGLAGNDQEIILHVVDTGVGIEPEKQRVIFEPFKQADDSTTRNFGGTGLGLAICNSLCKILDAKIEVYSVVEEGTRFTVVFPMPIQMAGTKASDQPELTAIESPIAKEVLVIDDNVTNCLIIEQFLNSISCRTEIFTDSMHALDYYQQNAERFDVIILDLHMPKMNGIQLAKHIKAINATQLIVLCTADVMSKNELSSTPDMFDAVIHKPVLRSELLHVINEFNL